MLWLICTSIASAKGIHRDTKHPLPGTSAELASGTCGGWGILQEAEGAYWGKDVAWPGQSCTMAVYHSCKTHRGFSS